MADGLKDFALKILGGAVKSLVVATNERVRNYYHRKGKEKRAIDTLYELDDRMADLERKAEIKAKKKKTHEQNIQMTSETINETVKKAQQQPPCNWIIPGILREGEICNIVAAKKVGKSTLAFQIAHECAYNQNSSLVPDNLDYRTSPQEVFYYDSENSVDTILDRYEKLNDGKVHRFLQAYFEKPQDLVEHVRLSTEEINNNVLVIIDNVTAISTRFSGNDVNKLRKEFGKMQSEFISRGYRLTFILLHHTKTGKTGLGQDETAGAKEWEGLATQTLVLCNTPNDSETRWLTVNNSRGKNELLEDDEALCLKIKECPYLHFEYIATEKTSGVSCKNTNNSQAQKEDSKRKTKWTLNDEETNIVKEKYVPNEYGLKKVAKDILTARNMIHSEENINQMKSAVSRALKKLQKESCT